MCESCQFDFYSGRFLLIFRLLLNEVPSCFPTFVHSFIVGAKKKKRKTERGDSRPSAITFLDLRVVVCVSFYSHFEL